HGAELKSRLLEVPGLGELGNDVGRHPLNAHDVPCLDERGGATASRACAMAITSRAISGRAASSRTNFRGHDRSFTMLLSRFFNFNAQIAHQPLEALLVAALFLPASKVSDVALTKEQASPTFRRLHHGIIQPHRE